MTLLETLSGMPEEDIKEILDYYELSEEIGLQGLSELLLSPEFLTLFVKKLPSKAVAVFDDAADASLQESCAIAPGPETEVSIGYTFKQSGYADVKFEEAELSEDGHSHISFVYVPEDVASLFKEIYTEELEAERAQYTLLDDSCFAAKALYGIAPVSQVLRVYDRLRILYPGCPRLKEEQFHEVFDSLCAADGFHELYVHNGHEYVIGPGDDLCDDAQPSRASFLAELMEKPDVSFYLPGMDSLLSLASTGADLSLQPYQILKIFLQNFFSGTLEDSTLPEGMSIENMDDVDDAVYELISEIWFLISSSEETEEEILRDEQDIFATLGADSRTALTVILKECSDVTNRILLYGRSYANR